jgi:hypothetical protein
MEPNEPMSYRIGLDLALEVDIVAGSQVVRVQAAPQSHAHLGLVCNQRKDFSLFTTSLISTPRHYPDSIEGKNRLWDSYQ